MPAKQTAANKAATGKASTKKAATKKSAKTAAGPSTNAKETASVNQQQTKLVDGFQRFTPYEPKEGEEYMSPEMEQHFREILTAWKRDLMEEVDRTVHHMQDEASNFPDPNDRATQESEFSMELRTRDRERKLIRKIDEALDKLGDGEYGYCDGCGIEIGIRRLEARPTANLCIDCKTLDEIREKQRG